MVFYIYSPKGKLSGEAAKVESKMEKYIEEDEHKNDFSSRLSWLWDALCCFLSIIAFLLLCSSIAFYFAFHGSTKLKLVWPESGPDPPLIYTACGGVVEVSQNGKAYISYHNGSSYEYDERCAWIVKSTTGKANLTFISHGFKGYSMRDGVIVAELNELDETMLCKKWNGSKYDTPLTVKTPAVVYFTSYNVTKNQGFVLEVVPMEKGGNVYYFDQPDTYHVTQRKYGAMAFSSIPSKRNSLLGRIIVFQPPRGVTYSWRRTFTVTPTDEKECRDYVTAYELPKFHKYTYSYSSSSSCYMSAKLARTDTKLTTDDAVIILNWGHGPANNTACAIEWQEDVVLKSRYSSTYYSSSDYDYDYKKK